MTREYAVLRPVSRPGRGRLTRRGLTVLYVAAFGLALLAGFTAELWNPYAAVSP